MDASSLTLFQPQDVSGPTLSELLQSNVTQTTLIQVNLNELVHNLRNLENGMNKRWLLMEKSFENMERKICLA